MTEDKTCRECDHFVYICAGCFLCELTNKVVVDEGEPTEDFKICKGKEFIEI